MQSVKERIRRVDINKLQAEQAEKIANQIGVQAGEIINQAEKDCNKFLEVYGLEIKIGYTVKPIKNKNKK